MSLSKQPIQITYATASNISQQPQSWRDSVLGAICFIENAADCDTAETHTIPMLKLHAPVLHGAEAACEWLNHVTSSALKSGSYGDIQYHVNDDFLFGVISLPESASLPADVTPLQHTTDLAYRQIFALMKELDYSQIYRFWNYMADINGISHGVERYRQFNAGRKDAYLATSQEVDDRFPAACALGLADGPLSIAFLLGRQPSIAIENPRQISAYEYPEEYGAATPSFSRATLLHTELSALLFISGTASIVGHQTQHPLDVIAQTRETLLNLETVIAEANRILGRQKFNLNEIFFRVYVRYAADLPLIQNEMQRYLNSTIKAVFIQADICRQELLLEIEATADAELVNA
jgi:enamine deaminase RidA (YjgF/YER057c/UK114 family)